MVMYNFSVNCYIESKDTQLLKEFCKEHEFEFEDDYLGYIHNDPEWQELYRRESGFSRQIKSCHVTNRTTNRKGLTDLLDALEKAEFDILVICEIS